MLTAVLVTPPVMGTLMLTLTTLPGLMVTAAVQQSGRRDDHAAKDSGASLRDRALRCNRRCASISAAIPRASIRFAHSALTLGRRFASLTAECRPAAACAISGFIVRPAAASVPCSRFAHRPSHCVRRRCRRRRAPGDAPPASFVRALLRSATAFRSAPRRALVSALLRTLPSAPPAACCARLPAAPAAPSATQSPWRLLSAGFPGVDSPFALPRIRGYLDALRRFGLTPDALIERVDVAVYRCRG